MPQTDHGATARLARAALEPQLAAVPGLAPSLPPQALDRLERYVVLLLEANDRLNLTRVVDADGIAVFHLLDALAALPHLDRVAPRRAADLGSGGGVPAIPLAIARPQLRWTCVESVGRKAGALREIIAALDLGNMAVVAERAEAVGRDASHRAGYDLVTARACAPLPVLAELALPLLAVGGTLVAWKGPLTPADGEVRRGESAAHMAGGGALRVDPAGYPALGGHTFVTVQKVAATPERYPRRPGEPARRPLG